MTRRIYVLLEAASPIAHGAADAAAQDTNERVFMRRLGMVDGIPVPVPHISENALRHSMLRAPLADHLLRTLGITGDLPRAVVNLLYSGGSMGGQSMAADPVVLGHKIKALYPSLDLLGGAVAPFLLPPGRVKVLSCIVARENLPVIEALFPDGWGAGAVSVFDLIGSETRTRHDSRAAAGLSREGGEGNQMIYGYEVLAAGARVAVEMTLDPWSPDATVSAIGRALAEWDGYFGGSGRQGRGRMRVVAGSLPDVAAYDAHLAQHAETMRAGLLDGTLGCGREVAG